MADTASTPVADGWQTVGDKTTSKLLEEGTLADEWTMYFERKDQEKNGQSEVDYMNSLHNVGTFKSFKGFLTRWEALTKSEAPGNIHLFKKGVRPIWEDEYNINGGKWVASLLKEEEETAFKPWLDLVVAVLSGHLGYTEDICGVVLSLKQWGTSLHIWNRDADDTEQQEQVKQKLYKLLKTKKVKYVKHRTALQKHITSMHPHHNDGEKKKPKDKWNDLPDRRPSPANLRQISPMPRQTSPAPRQISPMPRQTSPMPRQTSPFHKFGHPDARTSPDRRVSPNRSDKLDQDWNAVKEANAKQQQQAEAHKYEPAPPPAKNPWNKAPIVEVTPAPETHKAEPAPPPAKNPWNKSVPAVEVTPVVEVPAKTEPAPAPAKNPWNPPPKVVPVPIGFDDKPEPKQSKVVAEEHAPEPAKASVPAPAPAKNPWQVPPKPAVVPIGVDPEPEAPVHTSEAESHIEEKSKKAPRKGSNANAHANAHVVQEPKKAMRPRANSDAYNEADPNSLSQSSKITRRGEAPQAPPVWDGKRLIEQASAAPVQPEKAKVTEQPHAPKAKAPKPTPAPRAPVAEPEPEPVEPHKSEHAADEWHIVKEVKKVRAPIPATDAVQKVAQPRSSSAQHTRTHSPAVNTESALPTVAEESEEVAPAPTAEPAEQGEASQQSETAAVAHKQQSQLKKKKEVHKKSSKPTVTAPPTLPKQQLQLQEIKPLPIQQIIIAGGLVFVSIVSYYLLM